MSCLKSHLNRRISRKGRRETSLILDSMILDSPQWSECQGRNKYATSSTSSKLDQILKTTLVSLSHDHFFRKDSSTNWLGRLQRKSQQGKAVHRARDIVDKMRLYSEIALRPSSHLTLLHYNVQVMAAPILIAAFPFLHRASFFVIITISKDPHHTHRNHKPCACRRILC